MKKTVLLLSTLLICFVLSAQSIKPLAFEELPLGSIKPDGWLKEALTRQCTAISSNLDETYSEVCGERNGWLGGDGDQWERGPYWIDGLLPLAYILDDKALQQKVQKWVEWSLASQQESGQFGPMTDYKPEKGIQRTKAQDWWPRMVMLKIMQQYYNATSDQRVITFLDRYFRYQLKTLPQTPLNKWTNWAAFRHGDNMLVALWLYRITGEEYLLDLCDLLHRQGFDFVSFFNGEQLLQTGSIHCVNLAQGLKEPVIYYQARGDKSLLDATAVGMEKIRRFNGFPNGMYGGDETLHGNDPTQGSELCSAVELMYSYEEMMKVTGDVKYAEALERVAFNALPAQISDDFSLHQYFQQSNQIHVCYGPHNFDVLNYNTSLVFGFLTGYPCCLCNQHQGWPKFTQNLWYRTPDGGFAAMSYAPCHFSAEVLPDCVPGRSVAGKKTKPVILSVSEKTNYPFEESIRFEITLPKGKAVTLPLSFRIPSWSRGASVRVNGVDVNGAVSGKVCRIERQWHGGDVVELSFPMHMEFSRWASNSVAVERGPLVYSLKLRDKWAEKALDPSAGKGSSCWEITTDEPWNYAFLKQSLAKPQEWFTFETASLQTSSSNAGCNAGPNTSPATAAQWPWSPDSAPNRIKVKMTRIPSWTEYNGHTGPLPYTQVPSTAGFNLNSAGDPLICDGSLYEVTLIPYGCTNLRITQFPAVKKLK